MRLVGGEHVPTSGPFIVVANHVDWKDPPALEFTLRRAIRFMAKIEAFDLFFLGGVMRGIGCFPVRRGESDRRAIRTCLDVLAAGNPLGFFPEGTRSRDGRLRRAQPGVAFLARRSGAPILPVGIVGTRGARPFRARIEVRVGAPFRVTDLATEERDEQALADAIMRRVAALLPAEQRGVYAAD
jgi:1-acyl-sn-glycerol-3-phosphate acyltransferase